MRNWKQTSAILLMVGASTMWSACSQPPAEPAGGGSPVAATTPAAGETPAVGETPAAGETPALGQTPAADASAQASPGADPYRGLKPFADLKDVPAITEYETIRFTTDTGEMLIEVYPQAAPNAAKQFVELVKSGFYDNTPIFRVVREPQPFVAQFGINWRPKFKGSQEKNFQDDPSMFQLLPGTLAFAKAGPNTNSTQVFINYGDNSPLRGQTFSAFGRIVKGFEAAQKFKSVGDPGMGLEQDRLWEDGEEYLKELPANQKPTMIRKAELLPKK